MNDTTLGTALHDRVRDEHPDLDHLVRAATVGGTRIRRRRRIAATAGGACAVAAVAVGVALLGGSGSPHGATRHEPGFASDPTSAPTVTAGADETTRADQLQHLTREATAHAKALRVLQTAPVYVDSPDWRCDQPADEKFSCSQGAASVVVNWRGADSWADYQDPAKAGPETFVSDVHGQFFATVAPGPDTTHAQVVEVGQALVWAP